MKLFYFLLTVWRILFAPLVKFFKISFESNFRANMDPMHSREWISLRFKYVFSPTAKLLQFSYWPYRREALWSKLMWGLFLDLTQKVDLRVSSSHFIEFLLQIDELLLPHLKIHFVLAPTTHLRFNVDLVLSGKGRYDSVVDMFPLRFQFFISNHWHIFE